MRILMLAPQPFFQPRGTPFSEYYRTRAFTELGHEVDLVTYPIGEDVAMPGLRIVRAPRLPGVRSVPIGPSFVKVPLDVGVLATAVRRLVAGRYDLLDCHEEAGVMGVLLSRLTGTPTVYDMHSSLPEQLANFRFSRSRLLRAAFAAAEGIAIRGSAAVVVICPHLEEIVRRVAPEKPVFLIENSPLAEAGRPVEPGEAERLRAALGLDGGPVLLYTGTFEPYQGFELLFDALRFVVAAEPAVRLLLVGGDEEQVRAARAEVARRGLEGHVVFTGRRPPEEMSLYLAAGDVLVSPRSSGTNTPLKIYSYLRAGKPIVATRLLTHTQVLDDATAVLTPPEPEPFAAGILAVLRDEARARRLAAAARRRAEERYSYERYLERTRRLLDFVSGAAAPGVVASGAAGR